jgi:hypothetical protein
MHTPTLDSRRTAENAVSTGSSPPREDASRRDAHPPSPLDRLAMRVGLALVLWSRHEHRPRLDRDARWRLTAHRNRIERDRQAREQRWLTSVDELAHR